MYYNPFVDILRFSDLSSIYSHHMRQRLRHKMPMLTGLEHATKVVFDELPNDEWIEELSGAVIDHFRTRIEGIQQEWIDNGKKWKDDRGWKLVVREEEQKLKRAYRWRSYHSTPSTYYGRLGIEKCGAF
jgi:hypothetical protein